MLMMGGVGRVLAPAWRQRGVWLAGSFILLLGLITLGRGVCRSPPMSDMPGAIGHSGMTERGDHLCSHCLLPARLAPDAAHGERRGSCVLLLRLLHRLSGEDGKSEEWEAAWLLIRLGVGGFLSMNIMLISLLLYAGAFTAPMRGCSLGFICCCGSSRRRR